MKYTIIVILGVLAFVTIPCDARDLYVSASKGGTGICTQSDPCSVARALEQARRDDVVHFPEGNCKCAFDTVASGVTFKGAPDYKSRLLWSEGVTGKQIIGVRHDDITIRGLVIEGEKKNNQGHGLIRVNNAKNLKILGNRIVNSGSSHISLGGSWKNSVIKDFRIIGNYLCGSGHVGEYGESVYAGDYKGSGDVNGGIIAGNEICRFTDNAIDLKPPARNIKIYDNYIHDQEDRVGKEINMGTIVTQGSGHHIYNNLIQNVIGGRAVFNLTRNGDILVENNTIIGIKKTEWLVSVRADGRDGPTRVSGNQFCATSTKKMESSKTLIIADNPIHASASNCESQSKAIKAKVAQYLDSQPSPMPDPSPEPPKELSHLIVSRVTYGETGNNVVRVYVEGVDGNLVQMDKRQLDESKVGFMTRDRVSLTFRKAKFAKEEHPAGVSFYLDEPYPNEPIYMLAEEGWLTGTPMIDALIDRHGQGEPEPEPEPAPIVDLEPGQSATCGGTVNFSAHPSGMSMMNCLKE